MVIRKKLTHNWMEQVQQVNRSSAQRNALEFVGIALMFVGLFVGLFCAIFWTSTIGNPASSDTTATFTVMSVCSGVCIALSFVLRSFRRR